MVELLVQPNRLEEYLIHRVVFDSSLVLIGYSRRLGLFTSQEYAFIDLWNFCLDLVKCGLRVSIVRDCVVLRDYHLWVVYSVGDCSWYVRGGVDEAKEALKMVGNSCV